MLSPNHSWNLLLRTIVLSIVFLTFAISSASAQLVGRANVIDTDTFTIGDQALRLFGVDGVEFHQFCYVDGEAWACGAAATRAFQVLLDPVVVSCEPTGAQIGEIAIAVCTSEEGDIAEIMVRQGWAFADQAQSANYLAAQEDAREGEAGVWRGVVAAPWSFREDLAAIERRYIDRMLAQLPLDAEQALVNDGGGIPVFTGFDVATGETTETSVLREIITAGLPDGFLVAAVPDRGVFDWRLPALALANMRQAILDEIQDLAVKSIIAELGQRPGTLVEVAESQSYYEAILASAAGLLADARQPVLMVASERLPEWIAGWFLGSPPEGADIVQKDDIADPNYLGTIDGIDVFVGGTPESDSYLFPADMLLSVTYSRDAGNIVEIVFAAADDPSVFVIRFAHSIQWLDDAVVTIRYPYEPPAGAYEN